MAVNGSTLPVQELVELPFDELMHQCHLALEADEKVVLLDFAQTLGGAAWAAFDIDVGHPRFTYVTADHIDYLSKVWPQSHKDASLEMDPPRIFGIINWKAAEGPWSHNLGKWKSELRLCDNALSRGTKVLGGLDMESRAQDLRLRIAEAELHRDCRVEKWLHMTLIRDNTTIVEVDHVDFRPLHLRD